VEISYPNLPISARKDELAAAIRDNQVVVIAGETGSGKTTQLPKICLELGRGDNGKLIGHTQPRRLAARTVAQRIAEELNTPLGDLVGYSVRFTDQVSKATRIRLMTDGILLNEITRDRSLRRYDTLIIDEAHERSLNIDFLLGYLRDLLPRRRDLKLIITSATIDPQRFADYYATALDRPVPVIEVSGRTYPVEVRYRPLEQEIEDEDGVLLSEQRDEIEGIIGAIRELDAEPTKGDILVFLSGEREIRDTAEAINGLKLYDTEVLPLYARLSTAEQQRVFAPHSKRRVVLSTNVAETSLTVPGIKYVIDPGTARISRYSRRTKVQRLPIEPISQASAGQRAGRCGRTSDGVCIRLYSHGDYESRTRFTDPEILRTNLASVLLQMANLRLGSVEDFGFLDPPDRRAVRDGVLLLEELGAMDSDGITALGKRLARLPLDPRIGRMILQAEREGCVREVLILAAALSIPDPRERPADMQEKARLLHARFADPDSDFSALLNLWNYLAEQRDTLSGNGFRTLCREEFLHYLRLREWQDLRGQLRSIARELGIAENTEPAASERVHAALIAGLLSHVGMRDGNSRTFSGARNTKFVLAPGSPLASKPPQWVVAAEIVETTRLFGRTAARVDPAVLEPLAEHLVQRTYSEPQWDPRRGGAVAYERVTLYGLPIIARRTVGYARIDPEHARELFIQKALVEGEWETRHHFFAGNQELREELAALEERARRGDLLVGDEAIYAFYDSKVPAKITSQRHFDAWWKKQRHETPNLLTLSRDDLLAASFGEEDGHGAAFPRQWHSGTDALSLTYRFEPGAEDDGVTVHLPAEVLSRLGGDDIAAFSWQIPALREELVTALLRSLPKDLRRAFVPVPDTARAVLASAVDPDGPEPTEPLLDVVQRALFERTGVLVPLSSFDLDKLPPHLRMTYSIDAEDGTQIAHGKDVVALRQQLFRPAEPESTESAEEEREHVRVRRELRAALPSPVKSVERGLSQRARLVLKANPDGSLESLINDCADATVEAMVRRGLGADEIRMDLIDETERTLALVEKVLSAAHDARRLLPDRPSEALRPAVLDVKAQLAALLPAGFVTSTTTTRLRDLARYLTAAARRLEALPRDIETDRGRMQRVAAVQSVYDDVVRSLPASRTRREDVRDIAWFIEEFRVSLWAQNLGTARPVSEQRIYKAIDAITP
jgi:ATP-dependent helicase HrpA